MILIAGLYNANIVQYFDNCIDGQHLMESYISRWVADGIKIKSEISRFFFVWWNQNKMLNISI